MGLLHPNGSATYGIKYVLDTSPIWRATVLLALGMPRGASCYQPAMYGNPRLDRAHTKRLAPQQV